MALPFRYYVCMRVILLVLAGCSVFLAGCGAASPICNMTDVLEVSPATATADHSATPPGNQQQFSAVLAPTGPPGCPIPQVVLLVYPTWTNPAPLAISISSAQDKTNGLATCLKATTGAVTLTATTGTGLTAQSKTVALTCK